MVVSQSLLTHTYRHATPTWTLGGSFAGFWSRRTFGEDDTSPWIIGGVEQVKIAPPRKIQHFTNVGVLQDFPSGDRLQYYHEQSTLMAKTQQQIGTDLRDTVKNRAERHNNYFKSLVESSTYQQPSPKLQPQMAGQVPPRSELAFHAGSTADDENLSAKSKSTTIKTNPGSPEGSDGKRQRRQGVYERETFEGHPGKVVFKSVRLLRDQYLAMLEKSTKNLSQPVTRVQVEAEHIEQKTEVIEENLLVPPQSDYCSSSASGASDDEREKTNWHRKHKVSRWDSADSAVGQSDDDPQHIDEDKEDCTTNYRPPVISPYSPRGSIDHSNVPSKIIIEAQTVLYPVDRKCSIDCISEDTDFDMTDSRRQSCFTDDGDDTPRYRYWRTPSVVVSDYSDDLMGLTLEDIEYIRSRRKETSSSPDSSLHSSCSNLNYCGSMISALESEYVLTKPYRKSSNCSTCSTLSGDEDPEPTLDSAPEATLHPYKNRENSGWRKLRNIVQWTPFFQTYKKQRYPWVQLAGHQGNFKAGPDQGTILKKLCVKEEKCFQILMKDILRPYVPEYKGLVASDDGESEYIQLQDLLGEFVSPCVMDCKIGVRTYLEEELAKAKEKPKLRKDMYEKMCQIDPTAPTDEEHKLKGVTKPRYMVWRETISSTATLGFRIEGIRNADGTSSKDFKTTKSKEQIIDAFEKFTDGFPHAVPKYIQRLKAIKATMEQSKFFDTHEVIGSSLLFVHDRYNANVWLIDFAKTIKLPSDVAISHSSKWKVGNHEDGYLIGINNIIKIFMAVLENQPINVTPPLSLEDPPELTSEVEKELKQKQSMENT